MRRLIWQKACKLMGRLRT